MGSYWESLLETYVGGEHPVEPVLIEKTVAQNGSYNAADDEADGYSGVTVNVPNTYTSSDEGKVVTDGSLVSQTAITVTENGAVDTTLNNQVIVDVPTTPTPAPSVKSGAVFKDYDGTIVYSYTKEQVAELDNLPVGPTHDGLLFQKWNWGLSSIKDYVNKHDYVEVGATYITDDGKTRIYITLTEGRLFPKLGLSVNGSVDIDWGDGSTHDIMTGTSTSASDNQFKEHQYAQAGDYVITLDVTGTIGFNGSSGEGGYILHKYGNTSNVNEHKVYTNCITKIYLGSGVTSIGSYAFQNCVGLTSVTIPDGVTSIDSYAFYNCYGLTSVTIPDGVTRIGSNAFQNCYGLTSVTIPDGVTSISGNAFQNCYGLTSVTIPDGVTSIGSYAFQNCVGLTSVTIPDGVTSISSNAFQNCVGLTSVTIPDGVTSISSYAFQNCYGLTSVTIPDGVTSIGSYAFYNCYGLTSVTIPDGVTSIGSYAFYNCYGLTSVTIPDGVTSIGDSAFSNCYGLTSVTIPDGVTRIGNNAFNSCYGLTSVTIPDGVTSIRSGTFQNCVGLTSVTIPDGVTSIGDSAFSNCYGLGYFKFESISPPTPISSNAFTNIPKDCIIMVPTGSLAAYTSATNYPSSSQYTYVEY